MNELNAKDAKRAQTITNKMYALRTRAQTLRFYNPTSHAAYNLDRKADKLLADLRALYAKNGIFVIN